MIKFSHQLQRVHLQAVKVGIILLHAVKTNQARNKSIPLFVPACVIGVANYDDSSAKGLQYNRYKNNTLSPQRIENWFQYMRFQFNRILLAKKMRDKDWGFTFISI